MELKWFVVYQCTTEAQQTSFLFACVYVDDGYV